MLSVDKLSVAINLTMLSIAVLSVILMNIAKSRMLSVVMLSAVVFLSVLYIRCFRLSITNKTNMKSIIVLSVLNAQYLFYSVSQLNPLC